MKTGKPFFSARARWGAADTQAKKWLRSHPYTILRILGIALFWVCQLWILCGLFHPMLFLTESSLTQVLSTGIQVIAGLYGITLTGYIFFSEHLERAAQENETIAQVVDLLKQRYSQLILVVTSICLACFSSGGFLLLYGFSNRVLPPTLHLLLVNETIFFMLVAVVLILYFVVDVVDPYKFEKISSKYKAKLGGNHDELGNTQEFMGNCETIKTLLLELIPQKLMSGADFKPSVELLGRLLRAQNALSRPLWENIDKLIKYYSYMLYSGEMTASEEMCALARQVVAELQEIAARQAASPKP